MKTLIFVHGGNSYSSQETYLHWLKNDYPKWLAEEWKPSEKKWKPTLAERFFALWWRVFMPQMPCDLNAKYDEWLITFNELLAIIEPQSEIIFVWHSLGGCFLLKYFSEVTDFPFTIDQMHLLAACISEGDFTAPTNYEYLQKQWNQVHIWHAEDDGVVPFSTAEELVRTLPDAQTHFFSSEKWYGHFHGAERIPELEEVIFWK